MKRGNIVYDFEITNLNRVDLETGYPVFQVEVSVPRKPKIIAGVEIEVVPLTHVFSEQNALAGQFDGLDFHSEDEKCRFTEAVSSALLEAKGQRVFSHS